MARSKVGPIDDSFQANEAKGRVLGRLLSANRRPFTKWALALIERLDLHDSRAPGLHHPQRRGGGRGTGGDFFRTGSGRYLVLDHLAAVGIKTNQPFRRIAAARYVAIPAGS